MSGQPLARAKCEHSIGKPLAHSAILVVAIVIQTQFNNVLLEGFWLPRKFADIKVPGIPQKAKGQIRSLSASGHIIS